MTNITTYNTDYFKSIGCSDFQSKRRSKIINKWNKTSELDGGAVYKEMRKLGINILSSFIIETKFWLLYDRINPPTPYEQGMINFIEGKSKLKYNQIPLY